MSRSQNVSKVEPKADKGRRFQPPRRKERPAKGPGPLTPDALPEREASVVASVANPAGTPAGTPGPHGPVVPVPPAAPSAEMAWLLRASERFDQEAAEAA